MKTIDVRCHGCGEVYWISVKVEDVERYLKGTLIQDAFPYLTADEAELLLTNTCGICWDAMFGDEVAQGIA